LHGVLSQRLFKTTDGKRAAAIEILLKNARIESLIADSRDSEITEAIQEGKDIYGMQSFDQALMDLHEQKKISRDEALINATNRSDLSMKLDELHSKTHGAERIEDSMIDLKVEA
jgi:twitching motility protein PilT